MRLAHPELETVLLLDEEDAFPSLVIENRRFFRELLQDIRGQTEGLDGKAVLSVKDKPVPFSKNAELIDSVIGFSVNQKGLISKILAALEKDAVCGERYAETCELLQAVESYVFRLTQDFTADLNCGKLSITAVLKSIGLTVNEEASGPLERFLDYMELVREFDREKLFIFAGLRAYFADEELIPFLETARAHGYRLLLIDSTAHERLPGEKRLTVDADLCEF